MSRKDYRKRILWLLCAFFCATALFLIQYRFDNKYCFPGSQGSQGSLNLSDVNNSQPLSILTYGWEFYPQELIAPGEFNGRQPDYVYLGQYGGFEAGEGEASGSPHGRATYRLNILLPEETKEYALELPEIYSASRVWVNGRLVSSLGNVTDVLHFPKIRTGMVTFEAAGHAEIVVQAADSSHYYSGMTYPPAFGSVEAVSDLISFRLLRTCLMVISSLTIGLLYLLIGVRIGGERKSMLLFSLVSLFFAVHIMYPLFHLFGAGTWTYRLEDVSFYLFLTMLIALHCDLCGIKGRPKQAVLAAGGVMVFVSLAVPSLLIKGNLNAMLIYSAFLGAGKLLLFGWLIATALLNKKQGKTMNGLLLAGLCAMAAALLAQEIFPIFEPVRFGWQTENAGFLFVLLLAGGLWFDTVSAYAERAALWENMRLMKRQFSLQEENYRIISDNFQETRRMRHDLRHHLNTIMEFTKQKQYQALEEYLEGYENSTGQASWPVLCENPAANAVLTYYQQLAVQKDIPLSLRVCLPSALKLEGWKLGVIFGNLLENAIEASEKLPPEERKVTVYARITKGNLLITVKNSWDKDFSSREGQILSTKHQGAGIGISSVQDLIEKDGGQFYLTPGQDEFQVSVVLWRVG